MDETRKKIIIQEINSWKESRMLPEQYCNYLLALYSQGEAQPVQSMKNKKEKKGLFTGLAMGALFFIVVFLNYFTEISIIMQMAVTTFSIIAFLFLIRRFIYKNILLQFSLIGLSLLLLMETVQVSELFAPGKRSILYLCLFFNCGLWIWIGKKHKLLYFSIAGFLGLVVIAYFLLI
ncbi:hypothetical protein ACQKL5_01695 [Peribacillus sp. NPDC097675]|uniref:hypothetical protein n=1 Tax=Peribacillus sp. NPDC097675 TaxID=3390618 RepID=UPI003D0377B6